MGYTTGSCAAAAAKASAEMLLSGEEIRQVRLLTPKGIELYLELEEIMRKKSEVSCAVRKYSGDDPDVTNGILVYATVQKVEKKSKINSENSVDLSEKINLDGGVGIGRVTKPGLEQKIGQAAINKVPRKMICEAVEEVCRKYEYTGNLQVRLSVPEGAEVAKKTFNPRMGIEGGISILGTTGIVEPMSEKALTDTIYLEMKMLKENGTDWCYVVPGNYGMDFLRVNKTLSPLPAARTASPIAADVFPFPSPADPYVLGSLEVLISYASLFATADHFPIVLPHILSQHLRYRR
jgi:cobalt-precorrin-5B (C1)-methyltransferase